MIFPASCRRTIVHSALAVLVVAALSQCSWEESRELAQQAGILAQHRLALPSPIQKPVHDCDHETGCICKGATQVLAITAPQCNSQLSHILPPAINDLAASWLSDVAVQAFAWLNDELFTSPPVSGRQLRALYASLVI